MHQKSGSLCKGFCENRIRHGRAAELCQVIPNSSIPFSFSSELWFLFAPMARCAAFGVIGTAQSAKEKQKRDMQLDHLRAPIFVFIRETTSPSPSSLRDATSPKVRGFGITEKHFGFARGSPFGRAAEQSEAERARMPTSKSWFICNYPMISAS